MTTPDTDLALAAGFPPASREQWVKLVEKSLKGGDFEKRLASRTLDGIRIAPLYTRADALAGSDVGEPGAAPYTRGTRRSRPAFGWDIAPLVVEGDAAAARKVALEELEGGATALVLQLDALCGQGVAPTAAGIGAALDGVMLDICPVTLTAGPAYAEAADALQAVWTARAISPMRRTGHLAADPIGWLALSGALSEPAPAALARAAGLVASVQDQPNVTALLADGHVYHMAGASEAEELAATLATLVAYLRAAEAAGIPPARALPKIAIKLAADTDQFSTIAKLRAVRRLVWRVADASGAGAATADVHLSATTAWRMMSKRDPWTNMLRTTMAAAAAALGGADQITVLPFSFALGKPDRFARRIARNTQLVLAEESSLGRVVDPAGGSWYVEALTDELARKAWALFQEIESAGGIVAALASGLLQSRIAETAARRATAIATGRVELTGVSAFPLLGDDGVAVEPWQTGPGPVHAPAAVTVAPLAIKRLAEPFEALRDAADAAARASGTPPTVFLASLGEIAEHTLRTTWVRNHLAAGGVAALASDGYPDAAAAASAFTASGARAACICSSDALYAVHAEATARALKAAGATLVLMAGRPGDREPALRAAGVERFLFAGQDAIEVLGALQAQLS